MNITNKRPLKVFLCHAHADRDPVRGLYTRLTKDGVDAWLDKAKLLPGQDWELEIRKAVREADVVVVCLSKQFNQAGFRQKEVRLALDTAMEKPEGEIFIIPARLEECDNLESLRKWHWVDLFEDDGYEMLMRALRTRADNIGVIFLMEKNKFSEQSLSSPSTTSKEFLRDRVLDSENPLRNLRYLLPLALLIFFLLADAIIITTTLELMGVISFSSVPEILQRLDLAILGGVFLSAVNSVWVLVDLSGVDGLMNPSSMTVVQRKLHKSFAAMVSVISLVLMFSLAVERLINLSFLESTPTMGMIFSFISYALLVINNTLSVFLVFQPATSGFLFLFKIFSSISDKGRN